ncbi:phage minor head protein [Fibrobacter succinogenes]|uniref:phage head morphogenesis protein n=1 Tax=Fibrobacter succinogenes TaxID=833 RepID=UPI001569A041|nr:phage minor head protein [Fibrobacter succinogenes]
MTRAKLRRLKARTWKYPLALERQYTSSISSFLQKRWKAYAAVAVPMMVPREDALEDLEPEPGTNGPAIGGIVNIARTVDKFNKKELQAFKEIAIGEAFAEDEPWVKNVIDSWSREQVSLITKASQDMLDTVARRIREGVKSGKSARQVTAMINADLPGISYRRARIIARDQTAKLNSALTQGRMADAGIETYIWSTSEDERVRGNPTGLYPKALPSHYAMNGKVCRWDDPTVWLENGEWVKRAGDAPYLHPGMDIMCRCVAIPNWDELEGVGASELPEPEPVDVEPPKVDVTEDQGLFQNEKTFVDNLSSRFNVDEIETEQLDSAFSMIKRMPIDAQKAYEMVLTRFVADISNGGKAEFNTDSKKILLFAKAKGNDLVHEAGHAIDNMIGTKYGRDFASAVKRGKFGNRNLGEIVKDEFVSPILESAKAYRLEALRDAAKKITPEVFEIIKKNSEQYIQANKILFAISDMDVDRDVKVFILSLFNSDAGDDVIKSLAAGNTKKSIEHLAVALNNPDYGQFFSMVDSMTRPMRELKELAKGSRSINSISDMFEAATGIPGIFDDFGHGFGYWAFSPDRKSGEAFAEILEMIGSDEKGTRKILDKYLPTARDFVLDLIKETR